MKKLILFCLIFSLTLVINAQLINLTNMVSQSAITPEGNIHLRMYNVPEVSMFDFEAISLVSGVQQTANFNSVSGNIVERFAQIQAPDSILNQFGFRFETTALNGVIPWQISPTHYPQLPYYIRAGSSNQGVSVGSYDANIDIRSQYFALTDTGINVAIQNATGNYPSALLNPNLYGAMIFNADRFFELEIDFSNFDLGQLGTDVLELLDAYCLIYANLVAISPGLYKIPLSTFFDPSSINMSLFSSLTPIGTIHSAINSNSLMLGVTYETLTAEPDFGSLPNMSNCLFVMPFALRIGLTGIVLDRGPMTMVYLTPYQVLPQTDTSIQLSTNTMSTLMYRINYSQPTGFYPMIAKFENTTGNIFNGVSEGINFQNSTFYFSSSTPIGNGTFTFSVDGINYETLEYTHTTDNDIVAPIISVSNYPNPFNPFTQINFYLSQDENITLNIYSIRGQKIRDLFSGNITAGNHTLTWDGLDEQNNPVSSGIYMYRLTTNANSVIKKMTLIK
jgi:hypothetical protein